MCILLVVKLCVHTSTPEKRAECFEGGPWPVFPDMKKIDREPEINHFVVVSHSSL